MDTATDTFTPDEVSAEPRQMATNGASMTISPRDWAKSDTSNRTLPMDKAHKIVKFYTDNPSWLADPRTSHAAEAILGSATKVISLNMQLQRANNLGEAARARTDFTKQKITDLSKVSPFVPPDDVEGQSELGRLNGMIGSQDFNLQEFSTGVSRLQSKYKAPEKPLGPIGKDLHDELEFYRQGGTRDQWKEAVNTHAKTTGKYAGPYTEPTIKDIGGKPFMFYRNFSPKPLDRLTPQQQQMVNVNAAALKQARKQLVAATDDTTRTEAQKVYDRELQTFGEWFDVISPKAASGTPSAPSEETQILTDKDGNQVKVPKSRVAELMGKGYH